MALFTLFGRLMLDNSHFNSGLQESARMAERLGSRVTHFFTKGFIALAGFNSLKSFINQSDRMVDSWFELNEQAKRFGHEMDINVLRKLVEARVAMRHLKLDTAGPRADVQGFFGKAATTANSAIAYTAAFLGPILGPMFGMDEEATKKRMGELIKEAATPFSSQGAMDFGKEVDDEMARLLKEFEDKRAEKPDKPEKETRRKILEEAGFARQSQDALARIGGFSQADANSRKGDELLNETKKIAKNTEGLNFGI